MSSDRLAPLTLDQAHYAQIARIWMGEVVTTVARQLLNSGKIANEEELNEADFGLLVAIAFALFLKFEDASGVKRDGKRHPAVLAFGEFDAETMKTTNPLSASRFTVTDQRTLMHGGVDDDLIRAVYAATR